MKLKDLSGRTFGRLTVVGRSAKIGVRVSWDCICECGASTTVQGLNLTQGVSRSCGCLQKEMSALKLTTHGMSNTRLYQRWQAIHKRCKDLTCAAYKNYGARGIRVCEEWRDFERFLQDMGRPVRGATIERKDNDGPYSKDNCRWASRKEQGRNKRNNRLITCGEQTKSVTEWAASLGIKRQTLYQRIHRRWSTDRLLIP